MARLSTDHGRAADRVASIDSLELHQAIATAAIDALRNGAPIERLDGLEYFHLRSTNVGVRNVNQQRRTLLTAQIERQKHVAGQARENANAATSDRLRDAFIQDSENAYLELEQLERQLEQLDVAERPDVLPDQFATEVDFIAHALAQLANIRTTPSGAFGDAINQVITDIRIVPHPIQRTCHVEFNLLLPADGMVLRFGPIHTSVANRAYPTKLPDDLRPDSARLILTRQASAHQLRPPRAASDHEMLQHVKQALVAHGYTVHAAGIIVRSDFGPLYQIAANDLWGEPLDDGYDPAYVDLVRSRYKSPNFIWDSRRHNFDCTARQQLVDAIASQGGSAAVPTVSGLLAGTKVDDQSISNFSRAQQRGNAPAWEPCVERVGEWERHTPRAGRSLRLWACPHCGGHASKVIRVPEVASCLLCPDCLRMATADSPTFPADYLTL